MEYKSGKRRKDYKYSDNEESEEYSKDRRSKKRRSRSRTPKENRYENSRSKRKHSKSPARNDEKQKRSTQGKETETKPDAPVRKAKETDMLNTRTGGAYIPPARLRMMQAQITDKSSVAYQRLAWEALKKSIHGHINKINVGNIGIIIKELLKENIVRGRGLLCRSVIQAQAASPTFTNVYAALVSAVNSRFPNIGELLLKRLVIQFKRGFKRNDKPICISSASFIAHLVNQKVAHEILALELLTLLVETPTDDSVEVAIAFLKECGQKLTEVSSKGVNAIFEMLRNILHEGQLDKRVQYMIEVMFQVWKDGFKDHPAVIEELELVPEEEQFTHLLTLEDATDSQDILNVFKFDDKYEENEQKYKTLSKEILGSDAESGEEGSDGSGSEESDEEEEDDEKKDVTIIDKTETNLVALRRTIYLTINSSLDFEECAHKLMKMQLKPGQEIELCHMFLDCCAEQRTYEKFYGLLAQRFCNINRIYIGPFEEIFKDSYSTAHRLDTNRLRNVSKFFAHLLFTDSISWEVLECVRLNEEDTTSSSRIYIKILFQELAEYMGLKKLNDRLKDPTLQGAFSGVFPRDNPKNTRFSINFFTSIGLGGLTDELREHLKQMPKNVPPQVTEINIDSGTSSDSSSSSSSSSSSDDSSSSDSSDAEENSGNKSKTKKGKKEKSKKPQTPEPEETGSNISAKRWGHDGFYDTYGQGARRAEPSRSKSFRPNERESGNNRQSKYQEINRDNRKNREMRGRSQEKDTRDEYESRKNNKSDSKRRDHEMRREINDNTYNKNDVSSYWHGRYHEENVHENKEHDGASDRAGEQNPRKSREETRRDRDANNETRKNNDKQHRQKRNSEDNDVRHNNDNDDESRHKEGLENGNKRRQDNENNTKHRRDDESNRRRKQDNENDTRRGRDDKGDTIRGHEDKNDDRHRRDDKNDTRRRRDDEDDTRRRRGDEIDARRRRDDEDDTRRRRGDEIDDRRRRDDESDTARRRGGENDDRRRRDDENDTRRRRGDESDDRRRRDDEYNARHRRDDQNDDRRKRDDENERYEQGKRDVNKRTDERENMSRKKEDKSNARRGQGKDYEERSKEFENETRQFKTSNKETLGRRDRNEEVSRGRNEREGSVRNEEKKHAKSKNNKSKEDSKKRKQKAKKNKKKESDTDTSSESSSSSDSDTESSDSDSDKNSNSSDIEHNKSAGRYWDNFDIESSNNKGSKIRAK